jgi:hypothetical protein
MLTESCSKVASKFNCSFCNYNTSKKSSYDKHLMTSKHLQLTNVNNMETKSCQNITNYNFFLCPNCNKQYKSRVGLWKHNKVCIKHLTLSENEIKNTDEPTDKQLIMMLIKENNEVKNMMMEQQTIMMKVIENGTNNNNTTNSHNKAFNLNFFLNETCKDAMNIMDFVDSIKLQLSDLERIGEFGFVDGISNIIIKNLKELDVTERPIHCTDKKREVLYIKDENKWEKDEEKYKIKKAIKRVANKNIRLLPSFKEKYPDCNSSTSKHSDKYNKIIVESMDTDGENENKIIQKITKEVIVEKDTLTL